MATLIKTTSFQIADGEKVTDRLIEFSDGRQVTFRTCPGYYTERPENNTGLTKADCIRYYKEAVSAGLLR